MEKEGTINYKELGLRCGIEIHQQLDTSKLFCNCPSVLRDDAAHFTVKRYLRAVAGETGEVDVAAAHEMGKQKHFIYEAYKDTTCLVELDEEPPHNLNNDALNVVLQMSMLLKAEPVDLIQVMRKTVVDGSNTSGFQRTALVAQNGSIETSEGTVRIATICVEEDAAKIVSTEKDHVVYRLDRLGIPLIEIATEPDIYSPAQCLETCEKIGMFLRSTGKVKRGIGTIRQDINVSIRGGNRIEIKGAQDLKLVPTYVEYEAQRQSVLLSLRSELKEELVKNGLNENEFLDSTAVHYDLSEVFKKTQCKIIEKAVKSHGCVLGVRLPYFAGYLGREVQTGRRLGTELSDYAKNASGVGGLFHSDELLSKYNISEFEIKRISEVLGCKGNDAFVLVADTFDKSDMAITAAYNRAKQTLVGIPKEVRQPNPDGTSSFMRPMPGSARMYPETDVSVIIPSFLHLKLPELISERAKRYEDLGLKELSKQMAKAHECDFFEEMVDSNKNVAPFFIADTLLSKSKELKTRLKLDPDKITEKIYAEIFSEVNSGKISKDAVFEVMTEICKGAGVDVIKRYELLSDIEIEKAIKEIVAKNPNVQFAALMGIAMGKLRGKADGKKVIEMLKMVAG